VSVASGTDAATCLNGFVELPAYEVSGVRYAPYAREVLRAIRGNYEPNTFVFAGSDCWARAERRRIQLGLGTAMVLPAGWDPAELRWPALTGVVVAWPEHSGQYRLKLRLAQALVRDGVQFATIEHVPEWIRAWRAGAQPDD